MYGEWSETGRRDGDCRRAAFVGRWEDLRRVCLPLDLVSEIKEANLAGYVRLVIIDLAVRILKSRQQRAPLNQKMLDRGFSASVRKTVVKFLKNSRVLRAADRGHYLPGTKSKHYEFSICVEAPTIILVRCSSLVLISGAFRDAVSEHCSIFVWRSYEFLDFFSRVATGMCSCGFGRSVDLHELGVEEADALCASEYEILSGVLDNLVSRAAAEDFTPVDDSEATFAPDDDYRAAAEEFFARECRKRVLDENALKERFIARAVVVLQFRDRERRKDLRTIRRDGRDYSGQNAGLCTTGLGTLSTAFPVQLCRRN